MFNWVHFNHCYVSSQDPLFMFHLLNHLGFSNSNDDMRLEKVPNINLCPHLGVPRAEGPSTETEFPRFRVEPTGWNGEHLRVFPSKQGLVRGIIKGQ